MRSAFLLTTASLLAGSLLGSCSHPAAAVANNAAATVTAAAAQRTPGTVVDSLDGFAGHHFGEPLSAFPGLVKGEAGAVGTVSYSYPTGDSHEQPWFAKHRHEVPGVFYSFRDGKFAGFRAIAYSPAGQAALARESRYLFGPGRELVERTEWAGQKAWAVVASTLVNARPVKMLDVNSIIQQASQEKSQQAQLQAENATR